MYKPQVGESHYSGKAYRSKERWVSYWHQMNIIRGVTPSTLLEVGPGSGIVTDQMRKEGVVVTTCDIAPDLAPDVIASITELPFADRSFDVSMACEVLEHIRFEDVPRALSELARVSKKYVIISLPHPGWVFSFIFKVPMFPRVEFFFQIPFSWKIHLFNGEHYWELGKRDYSIKRFISLTQVAGMQLVSLEKSADDPAHRFFLFKIDATT